MITNILIGLAIFFIGMVVGAVIIKKYIFENDANGLCVRASDGEVYLNLTEYAQRRLADPKTEMLIIRVTDAPTRNKHSL